MATFKQYEKEGKTLWEVRGYLGVDELTGKDKQIRKRGFKTKKEAQSYLRRAQTEFEKGGTSVSRLTLTFNQVYHEWLETYKVNVKESTLHSTIRKFEIHILPAFGEYRITKITPHMIQLKVNQWYKEYKKNKYMFSCVNRIMEYAYKHNYITENPCTRVTLHKKKLDYNNVNKLPEKRYYDKNELENLLNRLLSEKENFRWYVFFRLLAFTGLRRGEALALQWRDINFNESTLTVERTLSIGLNNKQVTQSPKTEKSKRTIGLDTKTIAIMKQWKTDQARVMLARGFNVMNNEQLVFASLSKNEPLPLTSPRNFFVRFCKRHDIEYINIHGFRHTHCSLLFESGVPMQVVKERLGHSDIQTTMNIYTHVTEKQKDISAKQFAQYVNF